jgi:O-methyltransferase
MDDGGTRESEDRLKRQIEAYHEVALAHACVKLGLPETMGTEGWTAARLAAKLGVSAPHLERTLRGLATLGLTAANDDGTFTLTETGRSLAPGAASSLREKLLIVVEQYWQPWANLAACIETGSPAFDLVFGMPVGAWREMNKEGGAAFRDYLAKEANDKPPEGPDIPVLRGVLQQHDDQGARAVLENWRDAMKPGAKLVVIERLMPERPTDDPAAVMLDLHMMAIYGGRVRTGSEMKALIADAGLATAETSRSPDGLTLITVTRP